MISEEDKIEQNVFTKITIHKWKRWILKGNLFSLIGSLIPILLNCLTYINLFNKS